MSTGSLCITIAVVTNPDANPGLERVHYALRVSGVPKDTSHPLHTGVHTRGFLPHVKREGSAYFVTFSLSDSLPQKVLLEFKHHHAEKLRAFKNQNPAAREQIDMELRRQIERYLDRGIGKCHLKRADVAQMVAEALLYYHEKQYLLDEWVIMPNHVHLILWPIPNHTLSEILRSRKRHTARQANLLLGRTGETFWQHESYDHWIRNDEEKARICRYIRNNPVNAGLCASPEQWRWGSAFCETQSAG